MKTAFTFQIYRSKIALYSTCLSPLGFFYQANRTVLRDLFTKPPQEDTTSVVSLNDYREGSKEDIMTHSLLFISIRSIRILRPILQPLGMINWLLLGLRLG